MDNSEDESSTFDPTTSLHSNDSGNVEIANEQEDKVGFLPRLFASAFV